MINNSPILLPGYHITHIKVHTCQIYPKYENKFFGGTGGKYIESRGNKVSLNADFTTLKCGDICKTNHKFVIYGPQCKQCKYLAI